MKFKPEFLENYICETPLALAIERTLECEILSRQSFVRPILDLGCGEGIFAAVLFNAPVDTGVDLNSRELDAARILGAHQELIQCPAEKIPKQNDFYQTVFSNSVLEHIPDIDSVLQEVLRLLSTDGHFYVTVPTNFFEQYSFGNRFLMRINLPHSARQFRKLYNRFWKHYHCYPVAQWQSIFERAGFEVRQTVQYCPRKIATLNDLLTWVALPSFFIKKLSNRWFISKSIRGFISRILVKVIRIDFSVKPKTVNGGLVFFDLQKKDA